MRSEMSPVLASAARAKAVNGMHPSYERRVDLIEGGLYSETAMREAKSKDTVYSRHKDYSEQAT